jgi:hypothetical protein
MSGDTTSRPTVLLVGDLNHPEFDAITLPLQGTVDWSHLDEADEAVVRLLEASTQPDLLVLVQSRPGEVGDAAVQRLQAAAPLAGIYAVLGSWCEGEIRTGKPWPGVQRCYWHQWPVRWREELARRSNGDLPLWALPPTMSGEEQLLSRGCSQGDRAGNGCIVVIAESCETTNVLSDAFCAAGFSVVACREDQNVNAHGVVAVLWETTNADASRVATLKERFGAAPIVAIVTFPRQTNIQQMLAAGIDAILAKPFLLDDLLMEIKRLFTQSISASATRKISRCHPGS